MFRSFTIGMVSTALATVPALPALADSGEEKSIEQLQNEINNSPYTDDIRILSKIVYDDMISAWENALLSGTDPLMTSLGSELDSFFFNVSGRDREHGEMLLTLSTSPVVGHLNTSLKNGEPVSIDHIMTTESVDLTDPATSAAWGKDLTGISQIYSTLDRMTLTVAGNGNVLLVDAIYLTYDEDFASDKLAGVLVPLSSVSNDSGSMPPSASVSTADWHCALYGFLFAVSLTACFGGFGGCLNFCLPCCRVGMIGCRSAWRVVDNIEYWCFLQDADIPDSVTALSNALEASGLFQE